MNSRQRQNCAFPRFSVGVCRGHALRLFFLRGFASASPVFAVWLLAGSLFVQVPPSAASSVASTAADPTTSARRKSASAQFARAEEQRAALNDRGREKRTLADYKSVVTAYRRVYLLTPRASEVPDALVAVAELYTEMGDRFGRTYYQSAVDSYQFLIREYPESRHCLDAYLRTAKLQKDQLGDLNGASQTYESFLRKYPHSQHKREAQEARAELALLQNSPPDSAKSTIAKSAASGLGQPDVPRRVISRDVPPVTETARRAVEEPTGRAPQIRKISAAALDDSTRVIIELESGVQYSSGRIANPDRIYFDLHAAKLAPQLAHSKIRVEGPILSAVRVAENPIGVVRVVLDVNGVADYSASLMNNPSRLVIDLYSNGQPILTAQANDRNPEAGAGENAATPIEKPALRAQPAPAGSVKSAKSDTEQPAITIPQPKSKLGTAKIGKGSGTKPDLVQPASAPQPTRDGQSTLTRTLGLKIGRIVIDAGHGGHDTGTIGPTGLMEKDLCLDVALRLGKIIQQRLPGADVVFTRSDDTFIPLEERTHIANDVKADMFISIHANSSRDSGARGIETYYLNLKGSDEAMEVAARENATSNQGIHELQDLVKQIARTEKIDESREFAEDVQDQLAKRVQKAAKTVKNRGVRKAPFVVLIGADMPSILTEISFLSNPADEKMLKQPEHRQRVAEGIYQGVASYLQSLNSVGLNQAATPPARRASTSVAVESSRNRN
jgi:N-acetylmuramoyl-L-alanine amidase